MLSHEFIQSFVDQLVVFATDLLMPMMMFFFVAAVLMRVLVYYTVRREAWFAIEFEKRVNSFISHTTAGFKDLSFYMVVKKLLQRTFYEVFEVRGIMKRRKPDYIMATSDRIFLINQGAAWTVKDILRQIKFLKYEEKKPELVQITKNTFQNNPCFNRVFGIIPIGGVNDLLNLLPGMFIIGGIFGTFLGIMKALPELSEMDMADIEGTKLIMDQFLLKVSFSMSTSIVGIVLSVMMTVLNTLLSPERLFVGLVERFESALTVLWGVCQNNNLPEDIEDFDENKDPIDALAQEAVDRELIQAKSKIGNRKEDSGEGDGSREAS